MPSRIDALDWLRGLMALSIMFFHLALMGHLGVAFDASTLLGRLGIYGVSIFFILSGLSMAIGYDRYITGLRSIVSFLVRRSFRIWPLLSIVTLIAAVPAYFSGNSFGVPLVLANMTALFGFIKPHAYINMGAWSIGNEMVYYSLTPLIILSYRKNINFGNAIMLSTWAIGLLFGLFLLDPIRSLDSQWGTYINPFNNLFLYVSGISIYYNTRNFIIAGWLGFPLCAALLMLFVLYPVTGDQIRIVTGLNRVFLSLISILIVFAFYKAPPKLPSAISMPLEKFGIATYGVYLLHPIVIHWVDKVFVALGIGSHYLFVPAVTMVTIAAALLSFRYVESPMTRVGKRLTKTNPRPSRLTEASI